MPGNNGNQQPQEPFLNAKQVFQMMSLIQSRADLAARMGVQFGGDRDLYETLGYKKNPGFNDYQLLYDREGIAGAVVDLIADETWRKPAVIIDGDARTDMDEKGTEFIEAVKALNKKFRFFSVLNDVDAFLGFSRYALIFLGLPGEDFKLSVPTNAQLAYMTVCDEGSAEIAATETTKSEARFGLPTLYRIKFDESSPQIDVHWSRVIHFKEGNPRSRIYGVPRLQRLFDRIFDWQKVIGGSSEAFWLLANQGLALLADENTTLPEEGTDEYEALTEELEAYFHNMQRYMRMAGVKDIKNLGGSGETISADGQAGVILSAIAITTRIPQRILEGSERGELASTQDDINFADVIQARQVRHVEPNLLRPFLDRMIELGVLPKPAAGEYGVEFPSLFQMNDKETVEMVDTLVGAISTLAGGIPENYIDPDTFLRLFIPKLKPALLEEINRQLEQDNQDQGDGDGE